MNFPGFKIKKINLRITLYFSILLIMIAMVISIINIEIYSDELSEEIDNVSLQKLSLIAGRISENINNIRLIHTVMLNDLSINDAFTNVFEKPTPESIKKLSTLLDNHHSTGSDNKNVIALGLNGEIYNPIHNFPAYEKLTKNNKDFDILREKHQYIRFTEPNTFPLEYTDPTMQQRNNITLYAQYYNYDRMQLLGYLAINFRKSDLFYMVDSIAEETFASTYIINDTGTLIHQIGNIPFEQLPFSSNSEDLIDNNSLINLNGSTYSILSTAIDSYQRWRIITIFDRSFIRRETNRLNQYIYLTLAGALIIMIFISWFISKSITNPIRGLIHSMSEFDKGHWPEPLVTKNEDEIKELIDGYNAMLTSFIKLTDDMIGRQQENQMIELDLIKTQLGLLEAQINPHFIHNTLNSMNYLALSQGNTSLSNVIESFNKLLHMSMAIDVSFITVAEEIENIKGYARIQKVRFEDVFTIHYDVDEDVMIGKIPKLILQPIVENSIIHGILPKESGGTIIIRIKKDEVGLRISILDDGVGIEENALKNIVIKDKKGYISKHIGVQNVYDRLKLYYDENMHFQINSTINQGTVTTIFIPYED